MTHDSPGTIGDHQGSRRVERGRRLGPSQRHRNGQPERLVGLDSGHDERYSIPFSSGSSTGGGSTGGNSPFALSGGSVSYSGSGTESQSGDNDSSYSSTGNYTLAPDGAWEGTSGTGWTQGNSFSSTSYQGDGTYSYNIPAPSGAGTEGSCSIGGMGFARPDPNGACSCPLISPQYRLHLSLDTEIKFAISHRGD